MNQRRILVVKLGALGDFIQALGPMRAIRDYHVGPSDKIKIDVFGVPELQREIQVDGAGRFAFPLIGIIEAAGRTPGEISDSTRHFIILEYSTV